MCRDKLTSNFSFCCEQASVKRGVYSYNKLDAGSDTFLHLKLNSILNQSFTKIFCNVCKSQRDKNEWSLVKQLIIKLDVATHWGTTGRLFNSSFLNESYFLNAVWPYFMLSKKVRPALQLSGTKAVKDSNIANQEKVVTIVVRITSG